MNGWEAGKLIPGDVLQQVMWADNTLHTVERVTAAKVWFVDDPDPVHINSLWMQGARLVHTPIRKVKFT